jgi:hypothetical protein
MADLPPGDIAAAQAHARKIAAGADGPPPPPDEGSIFDGNDLEKIWHTSAILILVFGITGGVIMVKRAIQTVSAEIQTAKDNFHWYNPTTWTWKAFF